VNPIAFSYRNPLAFITNAHHTETPARFDKGRGKKREGRRGVIVKRGRARVGEREGAKERATERERGNEGGRRRDGAGWGGRVRHRKGQEGRGRDREGEERRERNVRFLFFVRKIDPACLPYSGRQIIAIVKH